MNLRHSVLLLIGFIFLFASTTRAEYNSIVLLHQTAVPQLKLAPNDSAKLRYKKAMLHQKNVKTQVLAKFIQDTYAGNNFVSKEHELLPVVNGVAMNLTASEITKLKTDRRVYKIIPNTPVYLDKPTYQGPRTWGRGKDPNPTPTPGGSTRSDLNAGLVLHKVDQLIKDGVDINRAGKIVGVVDTGVDGAHPALKGKVVAFKNIATGSTTPKDEDTHGTHVSGIIAGAKIDGLQIGVYPGAKLVVAAALSGIADMLKGLQWIMDPDGNPETPDQPFVVNNSWHIGGADPEPFYRVIEAFKEADILLAFSAGNAGQSGITKPKEHPLTFTSAAVDEAGVIASFSSWGPAMYNGTSVQKPEIASMGVQVYSTLPGGKYGKMSGTSMASPFTAGAVALLGAYFPDKSPYLIAEVLRQTTVEQQSGQFVREWHKQMGYGLLDVYAAYLKLKTTRETSMPVAAVTNYRFQNSRTR